MPAAPSHSCGDSASTRNTCWHQTHRSATLGPLERLPLGPLRKRWTPSPACECERVALGSGVGGGDWGEDVQVQVGVTACPPWALD